MNKNSLRTVMAIVALSLVVSTPVWAKPASSDKPQQSKEIADPIEPVNRFIFGFNDVLDRLLIEPIAKGYKAIVPTFARDAVQSFMRNLESPLIIANNLLQGKVGDAGIATARFLINTTVGVGGLVDVAEGQGLHYKDEDFGQTLGHWGVGDGFYLVLPILGPSSLRDTAGLVVDSVADPVRIVAHNTDNMWIYYTRGIVQGIDTRSRMIDAVNDLRRNSIDYYAAARSANFQKRQSLIRDEKPGATPQAPTYDDPR